MVNNSVIKWPAPGDTPSLADTPTQFRVHRKLHRQSGHKNSDELKWRVVSVNTSGAGLLTCLLAESADSLREWLSVARVEAEQGSPGSGHAHRGVEKFSRR